MQISFWFSRETEVEHSFDCRDVEATRNQISRNQKVSITVLERLHIPQTLLLGQVAMDFNRFQPKKSKECVQTETLLFLIDKNDDSLPKTFET